MTLVCDLRLAVLALGGSEQLRLDAGARAQRSLLHERRPIGRTLAITGALPVLVLHEEVERAARARRKHVADLRLVQRDAPCGRVARGRALMCDRRGCGDAGGGEGD